MPTVTDEYGRTREVSMEEIRRALANADPGSITIQEVTTDIYTGKQTVRNIPVSRDGSFDLYGNRMRFNTPSRSSYTPRQESKEERERRQKEEEERRKQQALENEKVRSQVPEEMRKLMQQAESRYGCEGKYQALKRLQEKVRTTEKKLQASKGKLSRELQILELYRSGYDDQSRCKDLSEESRALVEEKIRLQEQLSNLGALQFGAKKQLRKHLEELDAGIEEQYTRVTRELEGIAASFWKNENDLAGAEQEFLFAKERAEKFLKWREMVIHIFMEKNPSEWKRYEDDIRPIFEYLDRVGSATANDIYMQHPRKSEFSVQKMVSFFRLETVKHFYKREMRNGMAYFSLLPPEELKAQDSNHKEWEAEAARIHRERATQRQQEEKKQQEAVARKTQMRQKKKRTVGKIIAVILACLLVALLVAGGVVVTKIQERAITLVSKEISGTAWKGRSGAVKIHPDGHTLTIRDVGFSAGNPPREYTYILEARGLEDVYMILENQDPAAAKPREEIRVAFRFENEFEIYMYFLEYKGQILRDDKYSD